MYGNSVHMQPAVTIKPTNAQCEYFYIQSINSSTLLGTFGSYRKKLLFTVSLLQWSVSNKAASVKKQNSGSVHRIKKCHF